VRQILPTIVVIGFMGAGKTSVGRLVARALGKAFDQLIYPALLSVNPAAAPLGLTAWREVEDLV